MANTDSAKKYMLVSAKKRARNDHWRSELTNLRRKFKKAITDKKRDEAQALFTTLQKTLDGAARRNIIHKNAAARSKSRLSATLRAIA